MNLQSAQKAVALIPLALLSTAWTASLAGVGASSAGDERGATLPDGTSVPAEALESPASWSEPGRLGLGVPRGEGIPSAALAAYQRAETVMGAADEACGIDWQLLAAIGRVESDHGRYGGNTLTTAGISRPGIYGIALDGTNNTAEITDTDAGRFDNDTVYDRAVGPMQFIPATRSEVGVDADGDGQRNPQDIDDAALASAVYLCSGDDDLATSAGRRAAVHRYNHSQEYVALVLSVRDAYLAGDWAAVPDHVASAVTFTPDPTPVRAVTHQPAKASQASTPGPGSGTSSTPPPATASPQPSAPPAPAPAQDNDPVTKLTKTIEKTVEDTTTTLDSTVTTVLSLPQAILRCTALGYTAITTPTQWNACIAQHTEG